MTTNHMTHRLSRFMIAAAAVVCACSAGFSQTISPDFFGINAWMPQYIGSTFYNGHFEAQLPEVKKSGVRMVRYGGIGVDKNNPTMAQYIAMIEQIRANGMEPIIQVPFNNWAYTATHAADIVRYVNKTPYQKGVKYWSIGNEPDHVYGYTTASQVSAYIKPFAKAMKAVDPTIKIIGPDTAWYNTGISNGLTTPGGAYDITGKDANGNYYVDIISFHTYPMTDASTRADVISKLMAPGSFHDDLAELKSRLANCNSVHGRAGASALTLAVTEANVSYKLPPGENLYGNGATSFLGGQFWAEFLGIAMKQGVNMVTFWSVVEGMNIGYIEHATGKKFPSYYHFKMLAQNIKGSYAHGTDNQTNVKAFGAKASGQVAVMILNQSQSTNFNYTLRLNTDAVSGANALKININAGLAKEYSGYISNQSSTLLVFDGAGNILKKIEYKINDAYLNQAPTETIMGDTTNPIVSITAPAAAATVSGAAVTVSANASDNVGVAGVQFKLDGVNLGAEDTSAPYSTSWNTTLASNAGHTLTAVARDAAGNTATSAISVTVSNAAQPFTDNLDSQNALIWKKANGWTNGGTYNVGWLADHITYSGGIMTLRLDNVASSGKPYSSGEYRTINKYGYGRVEGTLKAVRASGVVTSLFTYTGPSEDGDPNDEIYIQILGKDPTKMQVNYFTNGVGGHETLINLGFDASTGFHSYAFEWSAGSIKWFVKQGDGSWLLVHTENGSRGALPTHPGKIIANMWAATGADSWSGTFAYSAPLSAQYDQISFGPAGERIAPAVSIAAPAGGAQLSGSAVTVSANASDNVGVVGVQFKLDGANLGAEDTSAPYSASWDTTKASNAQHTLSAVARDMAGNTATSAAISVTVDNAAPTVSGVAASGISASAATIGWTSNEPTYSQVEYGTSTAYGQWGAFNASLLTSHSSSLSGLTAGKLYHYRIKSWDAADNVGLSGDYTFTTGDGINPAVSITAPSAGATISGSAVTVSANASDNVGVVGVQFSYDGINIGPEDTAAPFSAAWNTTQASNGSHILKAVARDAAGNAAAASITVNVSNAATSFSADFNSGAATGWTPVSGNWAVSSGQYSQSNTALYHALTTAGPSWGDVTVSADVNLISGAQDRNQLLFRYIDAGNYCAVYISKYWGIVGIEQYRGGVRTFSDVPFTQAYNTWYTLKAVAAGNQAQLYVNGVLKHSWTLPDGATKGKIGLGNSVSTARFDNVKASAGASASSDATAPVVSIQSPLNGASVGSPVSVKIAGSDNIGVSRVELWADGALAATQSYSPAVPSLTTTLSWPAKTTGGHSLQAQAYDAAGNKGLSAAVSINVTTLSSKLVSLISNDGSTAGSEGRALLLSLQQGQNKMLSFSDEVQEAAIVDVKGRVLMHQTRQGAPIMMSLQQAADRRLLIESGLWLITMKDSSGRQSVKPLMVVK